MPTTCGVVVVSLLYLESLYTSALTVLLQYAGKERDPPEKSTGLGFQAVAISTCGCPSDGYRNEIGNNEGEASHEEY